MKFDLTTMLEHVTDDDAAATRDFYRRRAPGSGPQSFEELKLVRAQRASADTGLRPEPTITTAVIEHDGSAVPIRMIAPTAGPPRGVCLDLHGGGFYMGTAADHDAHNRMLADTLGVTVVGVDYRLAPESPWPAAPDDCETVARWLIANAGERFGTGDLVIAGASAGATLAAVTLLRLRADGLADRFAGAALQFGTYDLSGTTPAGAKIADEYFLDAYLGRAGDRTRPDVSPIFGELDGLPPTQLIVGELDVLLADNLHFASRLAAAGNDVELHVYPAVPHGFTYHRTPVAAAALACLHGWVAQRLREGRAD